MSRAQAFLDFLDAPLGSSFTLVPEEALAFFAAKGLKTGFDWRDVFGAEHAASFTVAKMMDTDLLADVHASLVEAMANGTPFRQWADSITPLLQARGWWGRKAVLDPVTGQTIVAQLGSPGRLQTIFRTNMQSAYAVGAWDTIKQQAQVAPYLLYDAVDDNRTREEHAAWDGTVLPVDHPWWEDHYPPNGWNCRCSVIQLTAEELDAMGLSVSPQAPGGGTYTWHNPRTGKTEKVPHGVDPGFAFNVGEERLKALAALAHAKAKAFPPPVAAAAAQGIAATAEAATAQLDASLAAAQKAVAEAAGSAALQRSTMKAAERAAQHQLDTALAEKTPYLATAINQVKATAAGKGMSASELLAAAQAKAAQAKASANLSAWKKAKLAGKQPSAQQQAAFDALPDEAQTALLAQIEAQQAEAALQAAAQAQLDAFAAQSAGTLEAKALAKLAPAGGKPTDLLAAVQAEVAAQKAIISKATTLAGLKKSLTAGKTPTPAQAQLLAELTDDAKADLFAQVDAAKAKAAPKPDPEAPAAALPPDRHAEATPLNPDDLVQTGPQGGSNLGGEFTDPTTGVKWYVKFPDAEDALRNEALANALYRLAGVEVPEVRLIRFRGRTAIASRIVEGLRVDRAALTRGRVPGVQEHFTVDAWLGNWDVVGPDYANTKLGGGRAMRLDPGGALRYRAQGGLKGAAFGDQVAELDSLRNAGVNPHAASVFRHVTDADLEDGARRILAIPEERIRALVEELGPLDRGERAKLLATLLARREDLARRFPNARPRAAAAVPTDRVSEFEQREIEASRANGYTLTTDGGDIEDHHVVAMTVTRADGSKATRLSLKLRPDAAQRLQATLPGDTAGSAALADLSKVKASGLALLKGINSQAKAGGIIRPDKELVRLTQFKGELAKVRTALEGKLDQLAERQRIGYALAMLDKLEADLDAYVKLHPVGAPAKAFPTFDFDQVPDRALGLPPKPGEQPTTPWKRQDGFSYTRATVHNGVVTENKATARVPGVDHSYSAEFDGGRVTFIPDHDRNAMAARGYVQLEVDGVGAAATQRALAELERLGVSTVRSTAGDRLELYLDRHLYLRSAKDADLEARWQALAKVGDQDARNAQKLALLNEVAGFDVRTSPNWDPEGKRQAFGHGRVQQYRADLKPADLAKFNAEHALFHNPAGLGWNGGDAVLDRFKALVTGGGQLASQMDRIRRGVPLTGTSVSADFDTGGASYVFTRLASKGGTLKSHGAGFILKPELAQRLDAFSYSGDRFGAVSRHTQRQDRAADLDGMRHNARSTGNETNFRDSISLFDAVEFIVLPNRAQAADAIAFMRAHGYSTWPDGRPLESVIIPVSQSPYRK